VLGGENWSQTKESSGTFRGDERPYNMQPRWGKS
jgi:hypothetical protein